MRVGEFRVFLLHHFGCSPIKSFFFFFNLIKKTPRLFLAVLSLCCDTWVSASLCGLLVAAFGPRSTWGMWAVECRGLVVA